MLLGDTWWRELQSHTLSFPLACWTSLSSFYWLFWCLAFIICLLYRKWAKNWQGAYEGHVANLHLLIEIRHEGNINESHISLFRSTVLTKQKTKKNCKLLWLRAPTTSNLTWHASSGIKLTFNCCYVLDVLQIFWLFVFLVLRFTRLCEYIAWEHHISWSSYI